MSNKYLQKVNETADFQKEAGFRTRAAELVNKSKSNRYLKGALIGGTVAKAGVSAYAGKKLYDSYKARKAGEQEKKASTVSTTKGEPSATINANHARDLIQTGTAVGLGMAGTKLYERLAPKLGKAFGPVGKIGALAGSTLAADYLTVRSNNAIANGMNNQANKL